ncbi:cytochrome P450 [Amycolatopsis suaedae]|uniref:Cytochrome P450 n=1 Tax=Amycolatopsis suaedae TaxID=2510978 RepID=A0A4Q7J1M6_9PSEU|nr:cytochrome P450 [Amycolatopsis suaedae]
MARAAVPPGPPRRSTFSLLRKLFTDRLALMTDAAAYGDVVRVAIGPKSLYLVNHPEHAKHVLADNAANYHKGIGLREAKAVLGEGLLTSDGEVWRQQRRRVSPVFQAKRVAAHAGLVASEVDGLVRRLRAREGHGALEIGHELTGLTLGVLGRALLETDLGPYASLGHSFEAVQDQAMFRAVTLGMVPRWLPLRIQRRFRSSRADLFRVADELLDRHLAEPPGADLLRRLVPGGDRADRAQARAELITVLLAGHETTSSTLGWAFHLIDRHPEVAQRLHEEAVEVLGDRLPGYDDLHRLRYTAMVVEEVMRLYPPVWLLPRVAQEADEIAGYRIPAGADVVVVPYTMHRHPEFWADPGRFDPERFHPDRAAGRPRYAYIPFGAGPRFCVGNTFGMMEAVFVLAQVSRELRLSTVSGYRVVPEGMLSLRVRGGLPMTVHAVGTSRGRLAAAA